MEMPHHLLEQSFEIKIQNLKLLILAMIGNIDEIRIAQQLLTSSLHRAAKSIKMDSSESYCEVVSVHVIISLLAWLRLTHCPT